MNHPDGLEKYYTDNMNKIAELNEVIESDSYAPMVKLAAITLIETIEEKQSIFEKMYPGIVACIMMDCIRKYNRISLGLGG